VRLSTGPLDPRTHWEQLYLPALSPIALKVGQTLTARLRSTTSDEKGTNVTWTLTVIDRRGVVIARSRDHEQLVGKPLPPQQLKELEATQRTFPSRNREGQPVVAALAPVPSTSWQVRVSAPFDVAQAPLNRSTVFLTSAALVAGLLTLLLGTYFASRISLPLRGVATAAQSLGRPQPLVLPPSSYKEVNMVTAALKTAAEELAKLRDREALIVRESIHRVKNVLAVVQSLIQQSFREGRPVEEARTTLLHRMEAIARAQNALAATDRDTASLADIVSSELSPHAARITLDGPPVMVSGTLAQTFSLLVHELATNALKYGALSSANGRVAVSWSIEEQGDAAQLAFRWQEKDGPPVSAPQGKGFGSRLLESALPTGPSGPARLTFDATGLTYEAEIPMSAISAE
jgi:two-component sensor histidine kinase